jgi:hypothetical protein
MDDRAAWVFLIPIIAIIGGCLTAIAATLAKARVREAEIRERIAMIEKGLVPPPEVDPGAFERHIDHYDRHSFRDRSRASGRHRRGGVILTAIGFGLWVLIGFTTRDFSMGAGVGGFMVILGLAFLVISMFDDGQQRSWPGGSPSPAPAEPHSPTTPTPERR